MAGSSSATQYYQLTGVRLKYNDHLFLENRDMGPVGADFDYSEFDGEFSVTVLLTEGQKDWAIQSGVPEVSMGHVQFKKDEDTGLYIYKFKRKNVHHGNSYGPPEVYDKELTVRSMDSHESVRWWDHTVPWSYSFEDQGPLGAGSLVDVEYSVWTSGKKRVVRLTKVGVIEKEATSASDSSGGTQVYMVDADVPF
jgi:hypothetical protein